MTLMAASSLITHSTLVATGANIIANNNNNKKNNNICSSSVRFVCGRPRLQYRSRVGLLESVTRASSSSSEAESKMTTTTITIEKAGVKIVRDPPDSKLADLGVRSWPKWGCPPSKFPWTYSAKEVCYLLKGKVKVYPNGTDEVVEIGAGDLVEFPKGMSCTWDVSEEVDKHYNFE